ncbi:SusC/RagA family TonB-linked outer membrane protein [Bacteroides nordii]|uniref:SusC/RagA family TonB-linked outer membrane protein n=1 Tax=Bacteroides nordii TaxID=291645 RepID=UPI00241D0A94|nr:TonB-dependent receptor [Bacteroides nordii]MBD9110668.1 TonB-dependent receptor [Bacteroides nordii]
MKKYIFLLFLLCSYITAFTQQKSTFSVSGVVYDDLDMPVPGANVYVKNSPGVGTITDIDGKFSLKAQKNDVIAISFLGYKQEEYLVTKQESNVVIKLKQDSQVLEETVIVGMGTQRKASVVGAITNVDIADIQTPATNINNMLGGRIPGIISLQRSGEPGKNISEFWIRGIGTFGANSSALVLIDGLEGNLSEIDPSDVESFSILKDASATAVYGVRGANGVVLVTTKRGTADKLQITGRANLTISHMVNMPEYLGAYEYAKLANEALAVRGNPIAYSDMALDLIKYQLDPDLYPDVNWQDEVLNRNALQQTYYVNAKGGGSLARYYLSLGMSNESSAYKQEKSSKYSTAVGYRTYNYRVNLDINLTKTTTIYFGSDGFLSEKSEPGNANTDNLWATQRNLTPLTIPKVYSTGQLPAYGADNAYSPYVMLNYTGMSNIRHFRGKSTVELKQDFSMITKGLSGRVQVAYDTEVNLKEQREVLPEMFYAAGRHYTGKLGLFSSVESKPVTYKHPEDMQFYKVHFESMLNYERTFAEYHRLTGLLYYYMSSEQKIDKDLNDKDPSLQSMYAIPIRYQGLSGRITYGLRDTYFLDLNFGYTGSANFAKENRFGFFPAMAAGWVPTGYEWVREKMPWLDFLKIRGSYGMVGNDRLTNTRFPYLTLMKSGGGGGWGSSNGFITEEVIGADNLKWEVAKKVDIGVEAKLFGERLNFVVDIFRDKRDGIYQERQLIPEYAGLQKMPYGNVGKMVSYGSDGNISFTQRINKDMSFTLRGNFTYSANEVQNWEQAVQKYGYKDKAGYVNNAYRGYIALGLFRDEADIAASPKQTFGDYLPGDIKYKDVNGDGQITDDDQVPLSYPNYPRLMYGFGGEFVYKNLTLGVLFKGTGNTDYYFVDDNGYWDKGKNGEGYIPFYGGKTGNVLKIVADQRNRWTPASYSGDPSTENPNAKFPRLSYGSNKNNTQFSTFWHANSRYLRLQEVSVNYNLAAGKLLKYLGVRSLDLQFVASDLCIWSPMKLWDAEQADHNGGAYPIPQRFAFQMYVNF